MCIHYICVHFVVHFIEHLVRWGWRNCTWQMIGIAYIFHAYGPFISPTCASFMPFKRNFCHIRWNCTCQDAVMILVNLNSGEWWFYLIIREIWLAPSMELFVLHSSQCITFMVIHSWFVRYRYDWQGLRSGWDTVSEDTIIFSMGKVSWLNGILLLT